MGEAFSSSEIIKYLFSAVFTLGGSYAVFIIKSMSKDLEQLKELLTTQIIDVKNDVLNHRGDIDDLYNLQRKNSEDIAINKTELKTLKSEFDRCREKK